MVANPKLSSITINQEHKPLFIIAMRYTTYYHYVTQESLRYCER